MSQSSLPRSSFFSLGLPADLFNNLESLGYTEMTPIQDECLPPALAGSDIVGQGKTGSGKTAVFGLCLLAKLNIATSGVQSLVLCPTRELAEQVAGEIRRLARGMPNVRVLTLCGGTPSRYQSDSLRHGTHIVVGTPGRAEDHLRKTTLKLDNLTTLVLDEADRMLDMGFEETLDAILEHVPTKRQTLLFSATFPDEIKTTVDRMLTDPVRVAIDQEHDASSITQHFYKVSNEEQRLVALRLLLLHFAPESAVVFCRTRQAVRDVANELHRLGFSVLALHGELEQAERDQVLARFANKSTAVLVATDVAARGLDIDALDAVINYHIALDPEVHVHRVGRTGRAGSTGIACTLFADEDIHRLLQIEAGVDPLKAQEALPTSDTLTQKPNTPEMITLEIYAGKKHKLRPGDILGALTGKHGIAGSQVGKIQILAMRSYVAVHKGAANQALRKLSEDKLKGRSHRARKLTN